MTQAYGEIFYPHPVAMAREWMNLNVTGLPLKIIETSRGPVPFLNTDYLETSGAFFGNVVT